jgi:hypothetical protein
MRVRIVMIAENDPAGTCILFSRALNAHSEHECRLITTQTRYNFDYDSDLHVPDLGSEGMEEMREVLASADVLHFHMTADEHMDLGGLTAAPFLPGKAVVHHHHGHPDFRGNPQKYRRKYEALGRKNLLVSTPDLTELLPGARWLPNLVPLNDPLYLPMEDKGARPLRIVHTPTRKDLKNTDELIRAFAALDLAAEEAVLDVIEMTPHRECLARKRASHIAFDHMQGYYGMASLEALSQGLPVLAGLSERSIGYIEDFSEGAAHPWIIVHDEAALSAVLRRLIDDAEEREHLGRAGRAFMLKHWNEEKIAGKLAAFYEGCS